MKKEPAQPSEAVAAVPAKAKEYFELKIPKFSFQNTPINAFLVLSLVILAFFLGMLTNKVIYLETAAKSSGTNAAAAAADTLPTEVPLPQYVDVEPGTLPMLGNKDAKVTIVEFSDFQCPFCARYITDTAGQINEKYIKTGKVKFAYRHYPLSFHPNAHITGQASECANEQNKFWEYHDLLFQEQAVWSPLSGTATTDKLVEYAQQLSLNTDQFRTCVETGKYKQKVDDDFAAGEAAQVDGTPAFFVNGQRITGAQPFSEFERVIEGELKK